MAWLGIVVQRAPDMSAICTDISTRTSRPNSQFWLHVKIRTEPNK